MLTGNNGGCNKIMILANMAKVLPVDVSANQVCHKLYCLQPETLSSVPSGSVLDEISTALLLPAQLLSLVLEPFRKFHIHSKYFKKPGTVAHNLQKEYMVAMTLCHLSGCYHRLWLYVSISIIQRQQVQTQPGQRSKSLPGNRNKQTNRSGNVSQHFWFNSQYGKFFLQKFIFLPKSTK